MIAGCGSSALSKDTYLSRGDAICKQTGAAEAKLKAPPKGNLPATATYLRSSADLIDAELAKLRKLAKPKGDGSGWATCSPARATRSRRCAARPLPPPTASRAAPTQLFTQAEGELSDVGAGLTRLRLHRLRHLT